jgi:aminopeptidase-like protein
MAPASGQWMHDLAADLFPLPRSITGDGVRATLARLGQEIPLEVHEVPTGTPVLDWTVPDEWNVREAWIAAPDGTRVVDYADSNLHLVGYSVPLRTRLPLAELRSHLHTLPDQPGLIPYRTAYYADTWGFCLPHAQLEQLPDGDYEVCIDATREPGSLSYGECVLPGEIDDEVLISCHVCHPSLANDNLSGLVVATALARELAAAPRRHTFRFLFAPGTIGAITWLGLNRAGAERIAHGLVLTCLGDSGRSTYKRSRRGDAAIDRAVAHVLAGSGDDHEIRDFIPWGYDERQYCSPGFDLPVGCLMRTPHGEYPEYHTSADDLDLLRPDSLADSLAKLRRIAAVIEGDRTLVNLSPHGEPQLGRRGLYDTIGGATDPHAAQLALLWVLNGSDGTRTLLEIADRAGMPFEAIEHAAQALLEHGLVAVA